MNFDLGKVPEHIKQRHARGVPNLGSLDDAVLPKMTIHQGEIFAPEPIARDAVLDSSAKLDTLTEKALKFYDDLLSEEPRVDDPKVLAAQSDAARTVMTTQLRVDDTRLRKRNVDTLAKLLQRIAEEEPKLLNVGA